MFERVWLLALMDSKEKVSGDKTILLRRFTKDLAQWEQLNQVKQRSFETNGTHSFETNGTQRK